SHERVMVTVTTPERNYVKQTDLQDGLRSLLGLLIATCGSPDVELFRPMARYHLPFGTLEESLFRIISVHFLQQYFAHGRQSITLDGAAITRFYEHISQINLDIVRRIRKTAPKDSMANALILLDSMANLLPMS